MTTFLKNHRYAILALVATVLAMLCLACAPRGAFVEAGGVGATTQPVIHMYTEDELNAVIAARQADFDTQATQLLAEKNAAIALAKAAQTDADKTAAEAAMLAAKVDSDNFSTAVDAFNVKVTAALDQITEKRQRNTAVWNALSGVAQIAGQGAVDPARLISTALTLGGVLLGVGGMADSVRKTKVINKLTAAADPAPLNLNS